MWHFDCRNGFMVARIHVFHYYFRIVVRSQFLDGEMKPILQVQSFKPQLCVGLAKATSKQSNYTTSSHQATTILVTW
jgi:hypothetical protein